MPITCTIENKIAEIVFDVPPVNAFNSETWMSLPDIITAAGKNPDVNCVLIRAEGRGFCGGVDIKEMQAHPERITILKALGAELVLTDPLEGSDGAILKAREMAAENPDLYWYANQYNNAANWQAHYLSTGHEIFAQTNGLVTHFITGLGTSGTLMGTGRYLRDQLPDVKILAFQPDAPFHGLEGLKHMPSAIKPGIYDESVAGTPLEVQTEAAHEMVNRLAREEGLFVGISSGAAAVAALQVASELDEGVVVTLFPDAGYKYLSDKKLWEGK